MEKINFYSLRLKKKFTSDKYVVKTKSGRRFAVATDSKGNKCWRILGAAKAAKAVKAAKKKK